MTAELRITLRIPGADFGHGITADAPDLAARLVRPDGTMDRDELQRQLKSFGATLADVFDGRKKQAMTIASPPLTAAAPTDDGLVECHLDELALDPNDPSIRMNDVKLEVTLVVAPVGFIGGVVAGGMALHEDLISADGFVDRVVLRSYLTKAGGRLADRYDAAHGPKERATP